MEPNLKMSMLYRILGGIICMFFMSTIFFIDYPNDIDLLFGTVLVVIFIAPVCIKGYISGQLLNRLPLFIVTLIKGKPPSYK
jgi:hypothetical protein